MNVGIDAGFRSLCRANIIGCGYGGFFILFLMPLRTGCLHSLWSVQLRTSGRGWQLCRSFDIRTNVTGTLARVTTQSAPLLHKVLQCSLHLSENESVYSDPKTRRSGVPSIRGCVVRYAAFPSSYPSFSLHLPVIGRGSQASFKSSVRWP